MVSRYMLNDEHCLSELGSNFTLWKIHRQFEHEGISACARIEISQNADNAY